LTKASWKWTNSPGLPSTISLQSVILFQAFHLPIRQATKPKWRQKRSPEKNPKWITSEFRLYASLNRNLPLSATMKPVPKKRDSKSKQVNSRSQPTAAHWVSTKLRATSNLFPAKKTGFLSVPRWQVQELQTSLPNSALLLRQA